MFWTFVAALVMWSLFRSIRQALRPSAFPKRSWVDEVLEAQAEALRRQPQKP